MMPSPEGRDWLGVLGLPCEQIQGVGDQLQYRSERLDRPFGRAGHIDYQAGANCPRTGPGKGSLDGRSQTDLEHQMGETGSLPFQDQVGGFRGHIPRSQTRSASGHDQTGMMSCLMQCRDDCRLLVGHQGRRNVEAVVG